MAEEEQLELVIEDFDENNEDHTKLINGKHTCAEDNVDHVSTADLSGVPNYASGVSV